VTRAFLIAVLVAAVAACSPGSPATSPPAAPSPTPTAATTPPSEPTAAQPTLTPGTPVDATPRATPSPADTSPTASSPQPAPASPVQGSTDVDLTRVGTGTTPDGWQEVTSADGECRLAVPADWLTDIIPGSASSPGLEATAFIAGEQFSGWPEYVQRVDETLIPGHEVLLSTDDAFLIRSALTAGDLSYVLAINRGTGACSVLVSVRPNALDAYAGVAAEMLQTLAAVP
jgi:hypothetical protein